MATRAQKAKVGVFLLLTAVIVAVCTYFITYWGKGGEARYTVQFTESVLGLSAGSPVVYLGVPVGTVEDIRVVPGETAEGVRTFLCHVDLQINPEKVTLREGVTAKLTIYSLATGTMVVYLEGGDLDGPLLAEGSEIPVKTSLFESVSSSVEDLLENINSIAATLNSALEGMKPGELTDIVTDTHGTIQEVRDLVTSARETVDGLKGDATGTVQDIRSLVNQVRTFTEETQKVVTAVGEKIEPIELSSTQKKLNDLLDNVNTLTEQLTGVSDKLGDATDTVGREANNIEYNVREGLRSLVQTLESVRELIENLRDNPSSLVRGQGTPKEQPK